MSFIVKSMAFGAVARASMQGSMFPVFAGPAFIFGVWHVLAKSIPTRVQNFTLKERAINAVTTGGKWATSTAVALTMMGVLFPLSSKTKIAIVAISISGITGSILGFCGDHSPLPVALVVPPVAAVPAPAIGSQYLGKIGTFLGF